MSLYRHVFAVSLLLITLSVAHGQEIELIQPLSMGNIVIANNNTPGFININQYGQVSSSSNIHIISVGEVGVMELTDFYQHVELHITPHILQGQSFAEKYSSEVFTLEQIHVTQRIYTESDGSAVVPFGGKLTTSGSGVNHFVDTTYTHQLKLTVSY